MIDHLNGRANKDFCVIRAQSPQIAFTVDGTSIPPSIRASAMRGCRGCRGCCARRIVIELASAMDDPALSDIEYRDRSRALLAPWKPEAGTPRMTGAAQVRERLSANARRVRPLLKKLVKLRLQGAPRDPQSPAPVPDLGVPFGVRVGRPRAKPLENPVNQRFMRFLPGALSFQ